MPFVISALVLVGAIAVLNLVLTLAVIRRLKEGEAAHHPEALSAFAPGAPSTATEPTPGLFPGDPIPDFAATATDGAAVSPAGLAGARVLYAFFSVSCKPCWQRMPDYVDYARGTGLGPDRVVSVVVGDGRAVADSIKLLESVGRVVVQPQLGPVPAAFKFKFSPTYLLAGPDGTVEVSGLALGDLPRTVAV